MANTVLTLPTRHLFSIFSHSIAVNEVQSPAYETGDWHSELIVGKKLLCTRSTARRAGNVWGWSDCVVPEVRGRTAQTYCVSVPTQRRANQVLADLIRQGEAAVTLRLAEELMKTQVQLLRVPSGKVVLDETAERGLGNWGQDLQMRLENACTPGLSDKGIAHLPRTWLGRKRLQELGLANLLPNSYQEGFRLHLYRQITGNEESTWRRALTRVAQAWPCEIVEIRRGLWESGVEATVFSTTGLNPAHHLALMR